MYFIRTYTQLWIHEDISHGRLEGNASSLANVHLSEMSTAPFVVPGGRLVVFKPLPRNSYFMTAVALDEQNATRVVAFNTPVQTHHVVVFTQEMIWKGPTAEEFRGM